MFFRGIRTKKACKTPLQQGRFARGTTLIRFGSAETFIDTSVNEGSRPRAAPRGDAPGRLAKAFPRRLSANPAFCGGQNKCLFPSTHCNFHVKNYNIYAAFLSTKQLTEKGYPKGKKCNIFPKNTLFKIGCQKLVYRSVVCRLAHVVETKLISHVIGKKRSSVGKVAHVNVA